MTKPKEHREEIKTGVTGLDEIFLGGVRANNIILVEGSAGSEKKHWGLSLSIVGPRILRKMDL